MTNTEQLLNQRGTTHGSFELNAEVSQRIKGLYDHYDPQRNLCDVHREALDVIALKLSRILSGQASFKDHWDDIAGYATLASRACAPLAEVATKPGGVTMVRTPSAGSELLQTIGK
jgi:hypothetical protein